MIPILIRMKFDVPPWASKRALKEITREAHRVQALEWHRQFVRLHFEAKARSLYGYQPRKQKYMIRKAREGKGTVDLVYSGLTREAMLRPPLIRAFPNRARVQMAGPSYVSMRSKRGKPNLGAEITAVVSSEVAILEKILAREVEQRLRGVWGAIQSVTIDCGNFSSFTY